jgi:cell division protein FtsL
MNDTPQHIKELQLKIWLSKSPAERLKQFMEDNTSLFQFWNKARESDFKTPDPKIKNRSINSSL